MTAPSARAARVPQQERSIATQQRVLDAAVDCLVERGYASLTTSEVSARADVSRGAQQHHFPHKATLVAEAVVQLHRRQLAEIRRKARRLPAGPTRTEMVLDLFWDAYNNKLFSASVELALSARHDEELARAAESAQRMQDHTVLELCRDVFDTRITEREDFTERLALALATVRGLALLPSMSTPSGAVQRHWEFARVELARLLDGDE